jgi:molybdopterin-guanine dinucleotide biosynthesis protein A
VYAVITAGGRVGPEFAAAIGTDVKALAPLGNGRLIDSAIDAARALDVRAIAVVGGADVRAYCADRVDVVIDAAEDGVENIRRALHAFSFERLVYLTSDLPFVDGDGLRAFVQRADGAAIAMALANADAYDATFPAAPSHAVSLGGERLANGSAFVIDRSALAPLERVAGQFFNARKSLLRLALLLGPALCLRFATKRLTISAIEARARTVLGVDARAIRDCSPGLCYDVDDIADWTYAHSFALADA